MEYYEMSFLGSIGVSVEGKKIGKVIKKSTIGVDFFNQNGCEQAFSNIKAFE